MRGRVELTDFSKVVNGEGFIGDGEGEVGGGGGGWGRVELIDEGLNYRILHDQ